MKSRRCKRTSREEAETIHVSPALFSDCDIHYANEIYDQKPMTSIMARHLVYKMKRSAVVEIGNMLDRERYHTCARHSRAKVIDRDTVTMVL